jgi:outer membrane protein TolC
VSLTYWELALAEQELQVWRRSLTEAQALSAAIQAAISVGKQPQSASAEVEVAVASRTEAVLTAQQALQLRSHQLGLLLGSTPQGGLLSTSSALQPPSASLVASDEPGLLSSLNRHPELRLARHLTAAVDVDIEASENAVLPTLDLALSAGLAASNPQSLDPRSAFGQVSLRLSHPFPSREARGALEVARLRARRGALLEEQTAQALHTARRRALDSLDIANRRAEVSKRGAAAATLDLQAERARFLAGRGSNFDVLRRQDELARAELAVLRAQADQRRAQVDLEALTQ